MVGPRPRPVVPRPAERRVPPRRAVAGIAVGILVALVAGLGWRLTSGGGRPPRLVAAPPSAVASAAASTPAAVSVPAGADGSASDWATALRRLDALRARAFATRDPRLLRQVYVPGPLLRSDAAYLARAVPAGCGLRGARTRYGAVRVAARRPQVVLVVTASLPRSELYCTGRAPRPAAGVTATRLRLELVRTSSGLRIADQRAA
jgi:hypothetical protein